MKSFMNKGFKSNEQTGSGRAARISCVLMLLGAASCSNVSEVDQGPVVAAQCEVHPPANASFSPELEWHWDGSNSIWPDFNQVMMTPVVVDVSGDGIPDVIFNTFAGGNYHGNGVMRAISGDTGRELWAVVDPEQRVAPGASIAAGDIDNDGKVELCTLPSGGAGVICFENTGDLKFRTSAPATGDIGISMADLEGDGTVELIAGNFVLSNTGVVKWGGSAGSGPLSFAADIDQDGLLEVVTGSTVYSHNGTKKCSNPTGAGGFSGVANFDADPYGEIVVVWSGKVSLLDQNCQALWTTAVPGGGGGPPNIADFDNDGQPEIGVAGSDYYVVFEANGAIKWNRPTQDHSSQVTGSSTFDFEGDGRAEVVYADEVTLRVYDGSTGAVRFQLDDHASGTLYENPVIVDVDGDDNAEIVVASNNYTFSGVTGIRAFRDRRDIWVNTRPIWNQHPYSVTNVNNDGSIPAHPDTNWLTPGLNTFRSNSQGNGTLSPFAAADLTITPLDSQCAQRLQARVRNEGEAAASAGLKIAFYRGNPALGGTLLSVTTLTHKLAAGAEIIVELANPSTGVNEVWAVVDDDGTGNGRELECREDNNTTVLHFDITPPVPGEDKKLAIWPPNHFYHTVQLSDCAADPWDECSGILPIDQVGRITPVTSDEVEDASGQGDGRTCQDMIILDSYRVRLRSERQGASDGRVYAIHYVVTDSAGNSAPARCTVQVPHDFSGRIAVDSGPASCVGEACPSDLAKGSSCAP